MLALDYVKKYRRMPWITRGMRVVVAGEEGHVAGGHESGNIAVKFPDRRRTTNCHPQWETIYYDKQGNVVADYREAERASQVERQALKKEDTSMLQTTNTSSFFAALLQRDTLKTVTLTQPWATLMAVESKLTETRTWLTEYTGPLAIHAAKGFPQWAEDVCEDEPFHRCLRDAGYHWKPDRKHNPRCLPLGQIVAVGWLEQVERITSNFPVGMTERAFGDYTPGRYAWRFSRMYRLATPIAARGSLGLWTWQPPGSFWQEIQEQLDKERGKPC